MVCAGFIEGQDTVHPHRGLIPCVKIYIVDLPLAEQLIFYLN